MSSYVFISHSELKIPQRRVGPTSPVHYKDHSVTGKLLDFFSV